MIFENHVQTGLFIHESFQTRPSSFPFNEIFKATTKEIITPEKFKELEQQLTILDHKMDQIIQQKEIKLEVRILKTNNLFIIRGRQKFEDKRQKFEDIRAKVKDTKNFEKLRIYMHMFMVTTNFYFRVLDFCPSPLDKDTHLYI